jgi:type IV pilus assembly protein PilX
VLVIAMIFLVVVSLLTMTSLHNVSTSELVLGNVRTTELAAQAADVALRHCEASVVEVLTVAAGGASAYSSTFKQANILEASSPPQWQSIASWDSTSASVYVLPLQLVNQVGMDTTTYKRPPECMVEPVPVLLPGTTVLSATAAFVVTARGFGPEVAAADASRSHPLGTEVWLQSHIQLQ